MYLDFKRTRTIKKGLAKNGPVIYWMSRDQRIYDNWALIFANQIALKTGQELIIVFCLVNDFLGAGYRHFDFMLKGLHETAVNALNSGIPFYILRGNPGQEIPEFTKKIDASCLVCDFDPLKIKKTWKKNISPKINIDFYEVDAHNIVPCWLASSKQEYGAYTFRPKIKKILPQYLTDFPQKQLAGIKKTKNNAVINQAADEINEIIKKLPSSNPSNKAVPEVVQWIQPGYFSAFRQTKLFINKKLGIYNEKRNDPNADALSNLSPFLHFGQISPQRVALEVLKADIKEELKEPFLEQLIIRRELADNFCFYNENYDSPEGFSTWAQDTLNMHRLDKRDYTYALDMLENYETHDNLWNAAQAEMVKKGKMHGYMRMYWAKKILEWTTCPEEAMEYAIFLNDKYELDGRDPNGYTGIAWSIGGIHDRPWFERDVFGKIRYMSYAGSKKKFDVKGYIEDINNI